MPSVSSVLQPIAASPAFIFARTRPRGAVRSRGILDLINSIINQIPYKVDTPTPHPSLYLQPKSQAFITPTKHFTPPSTVVIKSNLIGQNLLAHLKTNPFFIYLKLIIY